MVIKKFRNFVNLKLQRFNEGDNKIISSALAIILTVLTPSLQPWFKWERCSIISLI